MQCGGIHCNPADPGGIVGGTWVVGIVRFPQRCRTPMLYTDEAAHAIAPADKPRKVTVGLGLYLLVNPNGSRWWRFRFRFNGRQNTLSCGIFPDVGVGEAIVRRDQYRTLLADGLNPSDHN